LAALVEALKCEIAARAGGRGVVTPDLISRVTEAVLDEIREWQNRPLDPGFWCHTSGMAQSALLETSTTLRAGQSDAAPHDRLRVALAPGRNPTSLVVMCSGQPCQQLTDSQFSLASSAPRASRLRLW
jgi:hypothetical protein